MHMNYKKYNLAITKMTLTLNKFLGLLTNNINLKSISRKIFVGKEGHVNDKHNVNQFCIFTKIMSL